MSGTGRRSAALLLLAPFFGAFALFWALPLAEGLRLSLQSDTLYGPSHFVGLEHYASLLGDPRYWKAWRNTLVYAAASALAILPLALGLALLLQRCQPRARPLLRFALLVPGLTPPAVLGVLFVLVFDGPSGLLNRALTQPLGLAPIEWLRDPRFILPALVLQAAWRWSGLVALFLEAGLDGIPSRHYEVARSEGASEGQCFARVTLPGLRRVLVFVLAFLLLDAFALFVGAYVLLGGSGGTADAGLLLVTHAYQTAFSYGRFGSAAAISFSAVPVLLALLGVLMLSLRSARA